jgi:hypothetical protein
MIIHPRRSPLSLDHFDERTLCVWAVRQFSDPTRQTSLQTLLHQTWTELEHSSLFSSDWNLRRSTRFRNYFLFVCGQVSLTRLLRRVRHLGFILNLCDSFRWPQPFFHSRRPVNSHLRTAYSNLFYWDRVWRGRFLIVYCFLPFLPHRFRLFFRQFSYVESCR